jgi:hypothetical protein
VDGLDDTAVSVDECNCYHGPPQLDATLTASNSRNLNRIWASNTWIESTMTPAEQQLLQENWLGKNAEHVLQQLVAALLRVRALRPALTALPTGSCCAV